MPSCAFNNNTFKSIVYLINDLKKLHTFLLIMKLLIFLITFQMQKCPLKILLLRRNFWKFYRLTINKQKCFFFHSFFYNTFCWSYKNFSKKKKMRKRNENRKSYKLFLCNYERKTDARQMPSWLT